MSTQKRKYELRARADRQAETRRRIAAATAQLHEEVGPARTTVAEIARRAGVQRLTVYKNFPDDYDLFVACQGHFLAENPPPDPRAALALPDPVGRDRDSLPALDRLLAGTGDARAASLVASLADAFGVRGKQRTRVRAAVAL